MKILIVEDEFANFIHLAKLLNDDGGIVIEGPIKSVKDVKKYLNNESPLKSPFFEAPTSKML